ncbi:MAG TPA: hypothetical protein ENK14_07960, partial [Caldithrix sp.]|nr:hypothetical protein [Caldithrix sp.]
MKPFFSFIIIIPLLLLLVGCSKAPLERGDEAFRQGNYGEAILAYLEAAKEQPENDAIKEKIATAYFKQGELIYQKRRVLRAFQARVDKGVEYLPINLSEEMRKTVSNTHLQLALAYQKTRPENNYQKKEYFDKTLYNLEEALAFDPANSKAEQALQDFKTAHFQEMLDKGKRYYNLGKKDPLNYLNADYYLTNATKFNTENTEVIKLLKKVRSKALNVLDPTQQIPLAIADRTSKEGFLAYLIVIQNPDLENLKISAANFILLNQNGKEIKGQSSELFAQALSPATLKTGAEISGVVAFP